MLLLRLNPASFDVAIKMCVCVCVCNATKAGWGFSWTHCALIIACRFVSCRQLPLWLKSPLWGQLTPTVPRVLYDYDKFSNPTGQQLFLYRHFYTARRYGDRGGRSYVITVLADLGCGSQSSKLSKWTFLMSLLLAYFCRKCKNAYSWDCSMLSAIHMATRPSCSREHSCACSSH
jgi:hypothetical protein